MKLTKTKMYRGLYVNRESLQQLKNKLPIYPRGVTDHHENKINFEKSLEYFGSLEKAALYYTTSYIPPQQKLKPCFSFWSRDKQVALDNIMEPKFDTHNHVPILIESFIPDSSLVVILKDQGLYQQEILKDYTLASFESEDSIMVACAVTEYTYQELFTGDLYHANV